MVNINADNSIGYNLFFLFIFLFAHTGNTAPEYSFKQFSVEEGLSQSTVNCVCSDSDGGTWIGTKFGLNRVEQKKIKTYFHKKEDPFSIPDNEIHFVAEDSLSTIWVGTSQGLAFYRKADDRFIPVVCDNQPILAQSYLLIAGGVLFGGDGKLYYYKYATKQVVLLALKANDELWGSFKTIRLYDDHTLLLNTRWNGLWKYDLNTAQITRFSFIKEKEIAAVFIDSDKNIWVSPYGKGLYCYDRSGKLLHRILASASQLRNEVVLDLLEKDDELWIATDGGGISILNLRNDSIHTIYHTSGENYSLPVNSIYCLYLDKKQNIWAGTIRGGLIGIKKVYIKTYKDARLNTTYGLSDKTVLSLYEDKDGIIWVGTDGGGINRLDPNTNTFKHYPSTYPNKVVSITDLNDRELVLSFFGKGIYRFDKHTGACQPLGSSQEANYNRIFRAGKSVHIHRYDKDKMYLLDDSIYIYDLDRMDFASVTAAFSVKSTSIQKIYADKDRAYFIGSHSIFEMNNSQHSIKPILIFRELQGVINTACYDDQGNFWIGTNTGLYCYDPIQKLLRHISTDLFTIVSTVCADPNGYIWVGAGDKLLVYIVKKNKFILFSEFDGAYANEYLPKSSLLSRSGDVYMGGVMGLLRIEKNIPFEAYVELPCYREENDKHSLPSFSIMAVSSWGKNPFLIFFVAFLLMAAIIAFVVFKRSKNSVSEEEGFNEAAPEEVVLPTENVWSESDEQFMLKLNTLVHQNLMNPRLDVKFFTEQMAMSRASLYNKIKAITNMGVSDYINKLRMERAKTLLKDTELTILEISEQIGFANQRYFSTAFKQVFEITPSGYRQMVRSNQGK